jgi:hypothetical protein
MNARLYDPTLARMLSPDNLVGDPTNSQAYNRYSYVWNNPLKYTDPTGNDLLGAIGNAISSFVSAKYANFVSACANCNGIALSPTAYTMNSMVAPLLSAAAGFQSMSQNTIAAGQEAARLADGASTQQASVQQTGGIFGAQVYLNFDGTGKYLGETKYSAAESLLNVGQTYGRVLDKTGKPTQYFRFVDMENDVKDIRSGKISQLAFVKESEIHAMLEDAGAFDSNNSATYGSNRWNYIKTQGVGGGKLDFTTTWIISMYNVKTIGSKIFLVDGMAHNHYNFGNFLFGAAGHALGYSLLELMIGAHYNSLLDF